MGRSRLLSLVLAVVALAAAAWFLLFRPSSTERARDDARAALDAFAADWSAGRDDAAARRTDRPRVAAAALSASRAGLDGAAVSATVEAVELDEGDDDRASARLRLRWTVPRIGPWSYRVRAGLVRRDDAWLVRWSPKVVHPKLDGVSRLGTRAVAPERAPILDREGRALMRDRPVVSIAVQVDEMGDPVATARALAGLLDVDADPLADALGDAGPGRHIPVLTLRQGDFAALEDELRAIPGVSFNASTAPLAPSKSFGRALLGAVGPVTAEQVERSDGKLRPGDEIGQWGLQALFEDRLAGEADRAIVVRLTGDEPLETETLLEREGRDGRPLRTTLDLDVQAAAEAALGDSEENAALVAVQPSTGDVLAVANRPLDSTYNRGISGRYPPGSTFKVVSTAALLRDGLSVDETVECPATTTVEGRSFKNFEGSAAGAVPFAVDFAESCNTAFVALADRIDPTALPATGRDFGLGRKLRLVLDAPAAQVPAARDGVEQAAAMIGQARILASPLTMAGVAATVADGRWRAPRLLRSDPHVAGEPLDPGLVATLRSLMRQVVQSGTGTALAGIPGEVGGKSGTAEYGAGDPPPTHAWFIAYRDDLAISVLVEGGVSGGEIAAPIAARFFQALDAGA